MDEEGIQKQLYDAGVNHCLSFEQVSDEIINQYKIISGDFDTITGCKYTIPGYMDIGKLYSIMIEDCAKPRGRDPATWNVLTEQDICWIGECSLGVSLNKAENIFGAPTKDHVVHLGLSINGIYVSN